MRRYRQVIRFAFFSLILLGMSICCKASLQPEYYYQWMSLSSEQLLKMGNNTASILKLPTVPWLAIPLCPTVIASI